MKRTVIAFDLDDTLAVTKSPVSDRIAEDLAKLLMHYEVCVISGGKFEQFEKQLINRLTVDEKFLDKLHIMPTCGTRYYSYDLQKHGWHQVYAEDLSDEQKKLIVSVLSESAKELGYWEEHPYGDIIEDRGSQVTFSALGQQAPAEEKYKWDPDGKKKHALRQRAAEQLPDLEVRAGGSTSIDVTKIGIDKAYGIRKLMKRLGIDQSEILFIGDRLEEGGNDYPVKAVGIDTMHIGKWEETALVIEAIVNIAD